MWLEAKAAGKVAKAKALHGWGCGDLDRPDGVRTRTYLDAEGSANGARLREP